MSDVGQQDLSHAVAEPLPALPRSGWLRLLGWGIAGLLAFVVLVGIGIFAGLQIGAPAEVPIPNVVGQPIGDAQKALRAVGFLITLNPQEAGEEIPLHSVIATDPEPGGLASEGDLVTVTYRGSPDTGIVPPMTGLPGTEAQVLLVQAGLSVGEVVIQSSDEFPEGHVITCDPPDGIELPRGAPVGLTISSGPA